MSTDEVILLFRSNGDAQQSQPMSKYMKFNFPFLGIAKPKRAELQKSFLKETKAERLIRWDWVEHLWQQQEREFQYLAIDYLVSKKKLLNTRDFDSIEKLIITKSWWDSIDLIAPHLLGQLLETFPKETKMVFEKWLDSDSIWLKRSVIIAQLRFKSATDTTLLEHALIKNLGSKEFFINKALGWALREYAKTNAVFVVDFVKKHPLQPLSRREALKHFPKDH